MLDINDYQFSGISFTTYAFLTLTTGILAYATLAEESENTTSEQPSIVETLTNPEKLFEIKPQPVNEAPFSEEEISQQPPPPPQLKGGRKKRRHNKNSTIKNTTNKPKSNMKNKTYKK